MYGRTRQDLSTEKTERTGRFYAKHTDSNPFQRFSVCGKNLHKSLLFSRKGDKKKLLASVSTSASREWLLVEQKRFELSTYTMRTYRSSQLSYCPVLFGMSLI